MLKLIDTTKALNNYKNMKCAEVYCQSEESFTIICVHCEMKAFEFGDFLLHFRNVHLQSKKHETAAQQVCIKNEVDTTVDKIEFAEQLQELPIDVEIKYSASDADDMSNAEFAIADIDDFFVNAREPQAVETDDDASFTYSNEIDSTDEEEEEFIPKVLQRKKTPDAAATATSEKQHKCTDCDKSYKLIRSLENHIKTRHSMESKHNCTHCNKTFQKERELSGHMQEVHKGFPCPVCNKVYKSRVSLYQHKYAHSGQKFACDFEQCNKEFKSPKLLSKHKSLVHNPERNFVCETCGFRTKIRAALVVHNRSHTGERPFKCAICNKGFASQSLLSEHGPIHSTERPHKCDVCGAAFSRPKALYHHKHLHLAVKKFVCKVCGRAYAQASGLAGHMRQHKAEMLL